MYRSFLSWRWMRTRKTNIIGVVGIAVGVGALIMILSIMTGFLEQSKKTLRGGLSDLSVEPLFLPLEGGALTPASRRRARNWFGTGSSARAAATPPSARCA
jgi:ABC-type lipoprotein release transport system permease subunit